MVDIRMAGLWPAQNPQARKRRRLGGVPIGGRRSDTRTRPRRSSMFPPGTSSPSTTRKNGDQAQKNKPSHLTIVRYAKQHRNRTGRRQCCAFRPLRLVSAQP
jgi:hypothetical protein